VVRQGLGARRAALDAGAGWPAIGAHAEAPLGRPVTRARTYSRLALSVARSAERLDRYERLRFASEVPAEFLAFERSLCERRCLALLDAVRNADDPRFRWEHEGLA
jgi:hypothetical protein